MLPPWVPVAFWKVADALSARRDARFRFLLAQVELMRVRVPGNRVILTPEERSRLLKLGEPLGHRVDDLMGVVTVKTYRRWLAWARRVSARCWAVA